MSENDMKFLNQQHQQLKDTNRSLNKRHDSATDLKEKLANVLLDTKNSILANNINMQITEHRLKNSFLTNDS